MELGDRIMSIKVDWTYCGLSSASGPGPKIWNFLLVVMLVLMSVLTDLELFLRLRHREQQQLEPGRTL